MIDISMREGTRMPIRLAHLAVLILLLGSINGHCCSICDPDFMQRPTLRQSALSARFVVLGTLTNARLDGERGFTDLKIEQVIRDDGVIGKQKVITVAGYVPFDAKNPPRLLAFGNLLNGKIDVVRNTTVRNAAAVDYLRASLKIDERERAKLLQFSFEHLDSSNPEVAADAFHEFAKASDWEIAAIAKSLAPQKIRKLLKDPNTPPERVGVFAFLLGACGSKDDADFLAGMIRKKDERGNSALSGLLGGLIELKPEEGWPLTVQILRDTKRPFADRLAALGTLRFFHASRPKEYRKEIVNGLTAVVEDGDMADMALEDLRRWHWWELTGVVIKQYGKPSHASPIVKRAIVRYALCCPDADAAEFVRVRRKEEPGLVQQVEESLEFEKPSLSPTPPKIKQ